MNAAVTYIQINLMNWKQSAIQETKESLFKEKVVSRIKSKPICKEKITRKK